MIRLIKTNIIDPYSLRENTEIMNILLKDRTTNQNIIWATDSYKDMGRGYCPEDEINLETLKFKGKDIIMPRVRKNKEEKINRTRGKGEVFTPSWIIEKKVNLIEKELSELKLKDYINQKWLEITCGEAPYITSRYDAVTGEYINLKNRVGFLDRKLQRISEMIEDEKLWFRWALRAYQSSYGYEYQGDSLFIARENLFLTFIECYNYKFNSIPNLKKLKLIAEIISYNIFQMDGLKYTIPVKAEIKSKKLTKQLSFFDEMENKDKQSESIQKKVEEVQFRNWQDNQSIRFGDLKKNGGSIENMKFDVVIGNPPYQEKSLGKNNQSPQVYHYYIDQSREIADRSILITPARFLANTGGTPKKWNKKMLNDKHIKIKYFNIDSSKVFSNTDIKGGVVITYHDLNKKFEEIETFIPYKTLDSIYKKVKPSLEKNGNIGDWVYSPDSYKLSDFLFEENPKLKERTDKSHRKAVSSNVFERYNEVFLDIKNIQDDNCYIKIYGRLNSKRTYKALKRNYIESHPNLDKWKIFVPGANGTGKLGEVLSNPIVEGPNVGHTQTFISIGSLNTKTEAEALLKYIKSKFSRALLSIVKVTQNNQAKRTWSKIPLQDFTENSDIDWTKSISEIDQQLYKKYGLSKEEIEFIESNVKEME